MTTRDAKNAVRQEAIDRLKVWIKPGDTVYTQIKSVSRSGMSRVIQVVKLAKNDSSGECEPIWLGYNVAQACEMKYDRDREGVKVGGCGMDMGFHLIYELSHALFRDGFDCIGEGCPANDHVNGDRNYEPHRHSDPGYALKQRWL
jgi:hypothetical protein